MKYALIFFAGAIISSCHTKEEKKVEAIYPKIKSVLESMHDPIGKLDGLEYNPEVADDSYMTELQFSTKGQLVRDSRFDSNGNLKTKTIFKYDKKGNTIRQEVYASNGLLVSKTSSRFDTKNNLLERNEVNASDKVITKQIQEHHKDSKRWVVTYKKIKGSLVKTLECAFEVTGHNSMNNYYSNELSKKRDIYTYNTKGDRTAVSNALPSGFIQAIESSQEKTRSGNQLEHGGLKMSEEHEYDGDGNRIQTIQYDPLANKRIVIRYKYGKDRIEAVTLLPNKMISSRKVERYDNKQNVMETFRYGLGGLLEEHSRHLYEYDKAGNWTKHKTIVNNKSVAFILRQIEYY